jgi:hypothetical protein
MAMPPEERRARKAERERTRRAKAKESGAHALRYDTPEKRAKHAAEERARRAKDPETYRAKERARDRGFDRVAYMKSYNARPDQKAKRQVREQRARNAMTSEELQAKQAADREYQREYRKNNAEGLREKRIWKKYKISFKEVFAAQGFKCAIDHPDNDRPNHKKGWQVDHCHATGITRSILCGPCNAALGSVQDDPARLRAMADYIERHQSIPI